MKLLSKEIPNRIIIGTIYASLFLFSSQSKNLIFLIILLSFFLIKSLFEFYNIIKKSKNIFLNLFIPIIYIIVPISCIFLIKFQFESGKNLLTFLIILIWISDIAAYIIGRLIGRTRLTNISPNKTIEGLIGSLIISMVAGPSLIQYFNIELYINLYLLSFLISLFGNLGDYFESLLKRSFNKKDSGTILMSHGGILDRIDSLLIISPIFYWILKNYLN